MPAQRLSLQGPIDPHGYHDLKWPGPCGGVQPDGARREYQGGADPGDHRDLPAIEGATPTGRLLEVPGIRSIDLHRCWARLNRAPGADRDKVIRRSAEWRLRSRERTGGA